jgi:hypothetical protein
MMSKTIALIGSSACSRRCRASVCGASFLETAGTPRQREGQRWSQDGGLGLHLVQHAVDQL